MILIVTAAQSALTNLVILAGLPLLVYAIFQKWRRKRTVAEITERVGLRFVVDKHFGYCALCAIIAVAALLIWPPPLEAYLRDTSPQKPFEGLGLSGPAVVMALLYGVVATGFSEELLFRGMIAGSLSRRMPMLWANVLQSLIFLAPHLLILPVMPEMAGILPLVFVGAMFTGWVRIKSGSILGPTLIHAAANTTVCLSVAIRSADAAVT